MKKNKLSIKTYLDTLRLNELTLSKAFYSEDGYNEIKEFFKDISLQKAILNVKNSDRHIRFIAKEIIEVYRKL